MATGRFAAGQLPSLLLLLVAAGLQLTRSGHRYRPLLCAVAAGAGGFAAVDSLRVYGFTRVNHGGAYDSALSHTGATLPRAAVGAIVLLVALNGVRRVPARPKPHPSSHVLAAGLLAGVAVVLAMVAVAIGPALQRSRLHELGYGVPLGPAVLAAAFLAAATLTRRMPLLVAGAAVAACAALADLFAPAPLHYPLGTVADAMLLAAALLLLLASRRPAPSDAPPAPAGTPPPVAPFARQR